MAWQAWHSSLRVFERALSDGKVCERPCSGPVQQKDVALRHYTTRPSNSCATCASFKDILCSVQCKWCNRCVVATLARKQWQNWLIADLGKIEAA